MERRLFTLLTICLLMSPFVTANTENETVIGETISFNNLEQCQEQLGILLDVYNSLQEDYVVGSNCGEIKISLEEQNSRLAGDRSNLRKEVQSLKSYKAGFYFLLVILIVIASYLISGRIKSNKR